MSDKPLTAREVDELVSGLHRLARNLCWTWSQESQEIFQELSSRGWQNLYHNAVAILHEVSDHELRARLQDPDLANRVRYVLRLLRLDRVFALYPSVDSARHALQKPRGVPPAAEAV